MTVSSPCHISVSNKSRILTALVVGLHYSFQSYDTNGHLQLSLILAEFGMFHQMYTTG